MKHQISINMFAILFLMAFSVGLCAQTNKGNDFLLARVQNPTDIFRVDEIVRIKVSDFKKEAPLFNEKKFYVTEGDKELPSQFDNKGDIIFLTSFSPKEIKKVVFHFAKSQSHKIYKKRTQAILGIKSGYKKTSGYYTGGKFINVDSVDVPKDHFAHDALYRFEGPGWESDKVAYRFYLDSRNRTDIFGKKVNRLVLQKVGSNDLVSDSKESYTMMLDWGMDIFKVGESLGIGSIALWDGSKFRTVSNTGLVKCFINNGPIESGVYTKYFGWDVDGKKYNLFSDLSISAGSRLTNVNLKISDDNVLMCSGLAKHENCTLIKSSENNLSWGYIALYGKQSLAGDNLGIVIFYRKLDLVQNTSDSTSEILVLKTHKGQLKYYFAAAWQMEPNGINNLSEFKKYINNTALRLSFPVRITF